VASGANNGLREFGGVLGIAVLASIFARGGSYASGAAFVAGTRPAVVVGVVIVAAGAVAAALPRTGGPNRLAGHGRSRGAGAVRRMIAQTRGHLLPYPWRVAKGTRPERKYGTT
jgi:hypothetical protein